MKQKIKKHIVNKLLSKRFSNGLGRAVILSYLLTKSYKATKPNTSNKNN